MIKSKNKTIQYLLEHYRKIHTLSEVASIIHWDQNVSMPYKAASNRAYQLMQMQSILNDLWYDEKFKATINELQEDSFTGVEKYVVRNLKRAGHFYYHVPAKLILEQSELSSSAFAVWQEAKQKDDFKMFAPLLEKVFDVQRSIAGYLSESKNPYDALLDLYEPNLTAEDCQKMFSVLRPRLTTLLRRIMHSKEYKKTNPLFEKDFSYDMPSQKKLSEFMMKKMGYHDYEGRLDVSSHPFTTTLGRHDVRITTRYDEHDLRVAYGSTVHETGHALYELGIDPQFSESPLAGGVSLGIHESQSRFWENQVGKSKAFLTYLEPVLATLFSAEFSGLSSTEFIRYMNYVRPGFIRTEADEVTYNLHIILRFELENALINKKIAVKDLPELWRAKMKSYLGVSSSHDSEGVLQDVHWSNGMVGYFPTYTLGNLYSAQFTNTMKKDLKIDSLLASGSLTPIREWLRTNIHIHGSTLYPKELVKKMTGKELDPEYFLTYIENKFMSIYSL